MQPDGDIQGNPSPCPLGKERFDYELSGFLGLARSLERRPSAAESLPTLTLERAVRGPGGRGSSTPNCLPSGTWALGDSRFADPTGASMGALSTAAHRQWQSAPDQK